jgi:hypothetical protein
MAERGWLMESSTKGIDCDHGEEVHRKQQLRLQNLPDPHSRLRSLNWEWT